MGSSWQTTIEGLALSGSPWEVLESQLSLGPWVGAATYELACSEASLPHQDLPVGTLGMRWQGVRRAIHVRSSQAELWGFEEAEPEPVDFATVCSLGRAKGTLQPKWNEATHRRAVEAIQHQIREGAFYVANLCVPFEGPFQGDPITAALAAFRAALPPYGAMLDMGDHHLLCLSMERLLSRKGDQLRSEPIKGTLPLTGDNEVDDLAATALQRDPKERAEHAMIVDLIRNDLGRVAETGSVQVSRFMEGERFPTVQHLVSRVEAKAKPNLRLAELLRSVLPGGSVTGAPKHSVCAHLSKVEAGPRGFYCGGLGWIDINGDLDLALPIRTAELSANSIRYWAGGGITLRSNPFNEWREMFIKIKAIQSAIG